MIKENLENKYRIVLEYLTRKYWYVSNIKIFNDVS